jgi:uncharacterized repeat protein (TIGR02543 family)
MDETKKLTTNTITLPGYKFEGWALTDTGDKVYSDNVDYKMQTVGGVTLFAKWSPLPYTLTFNCNKQSATTSCSALTTTQPYNMDETKKLTKNTITLPGYDFLGWTTDPNGQSDIINDEASYKMQTVNGTTLYAKWSPRTVTITYNKNTDDSSAQLGNYTMPTYTFDANITSLNNTATRTGYTLEGWYQTPDTNTPKFANDTKLTVVNGVTDATTTSPKLTLYAKWTPRTVTITYNKNTDDSTANVGSDGNTSVDFDANIGALNTGATRSYYNFIGWYKDPETNTTPFTDTTPLTTSNGVTDADTNNPTLILYAKWEKINYTIHYELNGGVDGTLPTDIPSVAFGSSFSSATYNGFSGTADFLNWNTQANRTGVTVNPSANITLTPELIATASETTITLYAQYADTLKPTSGENAVDSTFLGIPDTIRNNITKITFQATVPTSCTGDYTGIPIDVGLNHRGEIMACVSTDKTKILVGQLGGVRPYLNASSFFRNLLAGPTITGFDTMKGWDRVNNLNRTFNAFKGTVPRLPAGFGQRTTNMGRMFDSADLASDIYWGPTTFINAETIKSDALAFVSPRWNGHLLLVPVNNTYMYNFFVDMSGVGTGNIDYYTP